MSELYQEDYTEPGSRSDSDQKREYEVDSSQPKTISRVPSLWWLLTLILMAAIAVGGHSLGLWTVARFEGERNEWYAGLRQRADVQQEWDRLTREYREKATTAQKKTQEAIAEAEQSASDRDVAVSNLARIEEQLRLTREARDQAQQQQAEARLRMQEANTQAQELEQQTSSLQAQLAQLKSEVSQLKADRQAIEAVTVDSQQVLTSLTQDVNSARSDLSATRKASSEAWERLSLAQTDWLTLLGQSEDLSKSYTETAKAHATLQAELATSRAEIASAKTRLTERASSEQELQTLERNVQSLTETLATLRVDKQHADDELARTDAKLVQVKAEVAAHIARLETLQAQNDAIQKDYAATEKTLPPLREEVNRLTGDIDARRQQVQLLSKQLADLRTEEAILVREIQSLKEAADGPKQEDDVEETTDPNSGA